MCPCVGRYLIGRYVKMVTTSTIIHLEMEVILWSTTRLMLTYRLVAHADGKTSCVFLVLISYLQCRYSLVVPGARFFTTSTQGGRMLVALVGSVCINGSNVRYEAVAAMRTTIQAVQRIRQWQARQIHAAPSVSLRSVNVSGLWRMRPHQIMSQAAEGFDVTTPKCAFSDVVCCSLSSGQGSWAEKLTDS